MTCYTVETFGWITLILIAVKLTYNGIYFVYVHFLGRLLGLGIDISKCGPWAGNELIVNHLQNQIIININCLYYIIQCSRNWCYRRNRKSIC